MKETKKFSKIILSMILSVILLVGNIPTTFAESSNDIKGYVTISVEKFTLGLGYIKEPVKVPFYEGDNYADITTRILGEGNYKNTGTNKSGFYLSSIKDNDNRLAAIPEYILSECEKDGSDVYGRGEDNLLGEFDYTFMAGWMYCVNNGFPNVGVSDKIPEDGDVVRWQFTVYGYGRDIGADGFGGGDPYVDIANKDALTEKVAEINSADNKSELLSDERIKEAYGKACDILKIADIPQNQVDLALNRLNNVLK